MGVNEVGERRSDFAVDDGVLWGGFSVENLVLKEDRMRSSVDLVLGSGAPEEDKVILAARCAIQSAGLKSESRCIRLERAVCWSRRWISNMMEGLV